MAADILRFLDEQQLREPALIGHSMGGKVAMQLAVMSPERVSRLVVVDISPRAYVGAPAAGVLDALLAVDLSVATRSKDVDEQLDALGVDKDVRGFLLMGLMRDRDGRWNWRFNLSAIAANRSHLGSAISDGRFERPTLFLRGEKSEYVLASDTSAVSARFPDARMVTIRGAGHWPQVEAPTETLGVIRQFLCE